MSLLSSLNVGDTLVVVGDIIEKENSKISNYSVQSINVNDAVFVFRGMKLLIPYNRSNYDL